MILLLWLSILFIAYIYFFREWFFSELAISFVPYIIWYCIIAIILETFLILRKNRKREKNKSIRILFLVAALIATIWIWTLYWSEYFWFYNNEDNSIRLENNQEWIKVFYSNILYKNTDYKSLQEKIEKEDPDIVILVEFSDEHEDEMKKFFRENYPYMNRNSWSTMLAGDVVFSKIPLDNITETHIVPAWSWNYSYIRILCDNVIENCEDWVDLYVIHTAAPVSLKNFEMRNDQLSKLKSDFDKNQDTTLPIMIIWDFNLSPWSYYYSQLTHNWNMMNALSFQAPTYTRTLLQQWIFRSHIDQLFFSKKVKISEVAVENLKWSDHRSFTFYFWVK